MKLKNTKLVGFVGIIAITAQMLLIPTVAKAADSSHYELEMWKMGVRGDSASINFGYIGTDGASLVSTLPIPPSLVASHGNDPSWTQFDSAAPILAYINKYGVDNNIQESMNPTCFDPSIFKALSAQGVNLSQLGGPNVPPGTTPLSNLVGKENFNNNVDKVLVGVGVPAPNLTGLMGTVDKASIPSSSNSSSSNVSASEKTATNTTSKVPQSSSSSSPSPTPTPAPVQHQKTAAATSTPKVGTHLNPVPQAKESASVSKADPSRTDPPLMAINSKTTTKIQTPSPILSNKTGKTPWLIYALITGFVILAIGLATFKVRHIKA
jgi:hypothetical protein